MSGEVGARIVAEITREIAVAETKPPDWKTFDMWVPGKAEPQGSKTRGRFSIYDDNPRTAPWKERVALRASEDMRHLGFTPVPAKQPVKVILEFVLPRLASAPKTRPHPPASTKPDLDKLARAVFDALTGPVVHDDAQIVSLAADKRRAGPDEEPGVYIQVERI